MVKKHRKSCVFSPGNEEGGYLFCWLNIKVKMKRVAGLVGAITIVATSWAQLLRQPLASQAGIGAYSLHHTDVFSASSNEASLSQVRNTQAGIYGERKFLLSELSDYYAAFCAVTPAGNFGLTANYFGFSSYRETRIGLMHARKLGNKLDIGIGFNYNTINIPSYGSESSIIVAGGAIFHLTDKFHTGIHINNTKDLPLIISMGAGYEPSELFFISAEIIKEENQPVNINVGLHYQLIPQLHIRAGIATSTSSVWIGAGFSWKRLRLDIVNSFHPLLGITPGLMILFTALSKKNK